jgi:hypothetical protein
MADKLLVTWIAPTIPDLEPLAWLNELGRIQKIKNVQVATLTGDAISLDDVAATMCEPCDVLVWSGHGQPGGLLLPDHSFIRAAWFAAQAAGLCRPRVVILAACGSQLRGLDLSSLTEALCRAGVNSVGFPAEAKDAAAGHFTIEFIRALAVGRPLLTAFDVALDAISGSATAGGVFFMPGFNEQTPRVQESLEDIKAGMGRIEYYLISGRSDNAPAKPVDESAILPSVGRIQGLSRRSAGHLRGLGPKQ